MQLIHSHLEVLINSLLSLITLVAVTISLMIWPKKKPNLFLLLCICAVIPIVSIFRRGVFESGDLSIHIQWLMTFFNTVREGNLRPIWGADLFFTYGHPLFLFIYPLPYYLGSLFHLLGFDFIMSIKLLLAGSFILSGIGMYVFVKNKYNKTAGFTAGIFYLFSPYHLVDTHFRNAIGETLAFAIVPFLFLATDYYLTTKKQWILLFLAAGVQLLILSHQAISVFLLPLLFFYSLLTFSKDSLREYFFYYLTLFLGILTSVWFLYPLLLNAHYTYLIPYPSLSFLQVRDLLYSPYRFGFLFQGNKGQLSFLLGYTQLFVIAASLLILKTKKITSDKKHLLLFCLMGILILSLLTLHLSADIWEVIPLLKDFQFTYRLLLPISFLIALLAGILVTILKKKAFIILLCLLTIFSTILNWGNRKVIPTITDQTLAKAIPGEIDPTGEIWPAAPLWYKPKVFKITRVPYSPLQIVSGSAQIQVKQRTTTQHLYTLLVNKPSLFRENTLYFPGWQVVANGKKLPVLFTTDLYPGIILFRLPAGRYTVTVSLQDVPGVQPSLWLSFFAFLFLIGICLPLPTLCQRIASAKKRTFFLWL